VDLKIVRHGLPVAVIRLNERMEIFSSAVMNGGRTVADTLMIMEVPKLYDRRDPQDHIESVRIALGLPDDTVGFMTAAEVEEVISVAETTYNGIRTISVATAGLTNVVTAGDIIENADEKIRESMKKRKRPGTVNTIGISPLPLTDAAKVNLVMTMTEAKTAAIQTFGYVETGTTSDAIAVVSPIGDGREIHAGTGTDLGISMSRSVISAVRSAVIKRNDMREIGTFIDLLSRMDITRNDLWNAALELYIPNPDWRTDDLRDRFMRKLDVYSKDINASSLIQAAIELERLGGADCICAMPRGMFETDPIHLIADEMLGMQLAQYIAGTRGLFEFHRFDRHKPGVIGKLGPFMDDIICGLVGGIMSAVYTELFEVEQ
jgi:alpha-ribazole phosphatase CobZ